MSGKVVLQDCWCDLQAFHNTNAHRTGDPQLVHNFSTLFPQGAYWTYRQRLMYSAGDSRYIHIVKDLAVNIMTVIGPGNCERRRWKSPSLLKGHMTTTATGENLPCAGSFRPPFAHPPGQLLGGDGLLFWGGVLTGGLGGVHNLVRVSPRFSRPSPQRVAAPGVEGSQAQPRHCQRAAGCGGWLPCRGRWGRAREGGLSPGNEVLVCP